MTRFKNPQTDPAQQRARLLRHYHIPIRVLDDETIKAVMPRDQVLALREAYTWHAYQHQLGERPQDQAHAEVLARKLAILAGRDLESQPIDAIYSIILPTLDTVDRVDSFLSNAGTEQLHIPHPNAILQDSIEIDWLPNSEVREHLIYLRNDILHAPYLT